MRGIPETPAGSGSHWHGFGRSPGDLTAIVVTHAHVDHIGAIGPLIAETGAPVYADPSEVPHVRREYLEQARELDVALRAWNPRVLAWSARILRLGATRDVTVESAEAFPGDGALDRPPPLQR